MNEINEKNKFRCNIRIYYTGESSFYSLSIPRKVHIYIRQNDRNNDSVLVIILLWKLFYFSYNSYIIL